MTWLAGDGFDFYQTSALSLDALAGGTIWQTMPLDAGLVTGRYGAPGLAMNMAAGDFALVNTFANSTTIWVNVALKPNLIIGGTAEVWGIRIRDGSSTQVGFYLRSDGTFIVTNGAFGGTILGTSTALFPAATWRHMQLKVVIDAVAGSVEIRLDGHTSADYLLTGINTRNGTANSYCNTMQFETGARTMAMDDLYYFNDQAGSPNTWQGDVRSIQLMPNADLSVQWSRNTGATNNSAVNQNHEDGDTTYIFDNTPGHADTYGVDDLPFTPSTIISVQLKAFARMDDAGPHTLKYQVISGATISDTANQSLSSSYVWQWTNYTTDPNTSAAWTATAVNALQVGVTNVL